MELPQLTPPKPDCRECNLGEDTLKNPGVPSTYVQGSLPPDPANKALILLGQNPGWQEDKTGLPFVGPSGDIVRKVFLPELMQHCTVYLMNVARCASPAGMTIPQKCYNTCYNLYTIKDIASIARHHSPPLSVLAMGKPAAIRAYKLLRLGNKSPGNSLAKYIAHNGESGHLVTQKNGPVLPFKKATIFYTYHPAAILRENNLIHPASDHISIVHKHLMGRRPAQTKPNIVPMESP